MCNNLSAVYVAKLAHSLRAEGKIEEAIDKFKEAIILNPSKAEYHVMLAYIFDEVQNNFEEAKAEYQSAISVQPDNVNIRLSFAYFLMEKGKLAEALEEFQELIRLNPDEAEGYYGIGEIMRQQKEFRKAKSAFQKSKDLYITRGDIEQVEIVDIIIEGCFEAPM